MSHIADSSTDSFVQQVAKLVFDKTSSRFRVVDRFSPHDNESFKFLQGRKPQTTKAFETGFAASRREIQKAGSQSIRKNERQDELRTLEITHKKSRGTNYVSVHNPEMWKGKQGIYRLQLLLYRLTHAFLICSSVESPASLKIFGVKWFPEMLPEVQVPPKSNQEERTYLTSSGTKPMHFASEYIAKKVDSIMGRLHGAQDPRILLDHLHADRTP